MKSIKDSLSLKFCIRCVLYSVQCTLQSHNFQALYSNISAQSGHNIPKYLNLFINGPRWDWLTIKMRVENLSWNTPFNVNAQKKDQTPPLFWLPKLPELLPLPPPVSSAIFYCTFSALSLRALQLSTWYVLFVYVRGEGGGGEGWNARLKNSFHPCTASYWTIKVLPHPPALPRA